MLLNGGANIDEFTIFEEEEVVFLSKLDESGDSGSRGEVGYDVNVGFQNGNRGAESW